MIRPYIPRDFTTEKIHMRISVSTLFVFLMMLSSSNALHALVVLQYHHVSEKTPAITSISPKQFAEHMQYLSDNNFSVIDIKDLSGLLAQKDLPDKTVIITFDDGYSSIFTEALPILKKHNFPFTVFISSEPHDQQLEGYLSWAQLRQLQKYAATLANHSYGHEHLIRQKSGLSTTDKKAIWRNNINKNQQRIRQETGSNSMIFAYPYGEYTPELQTLLENMGYIAFSQLSGPISNNSSKTALPRFAFAGGYSNLEDFILKVNTLPFSNMENRIYDDKGRVLHSPLLPNNLKQPTLTLRFNATVASQLQCFASGQGKIPTQQNENSWIAKTDEDLKPGRRRYNCTSNAGNNRFYWHSEFFMLKHDDGIWYDEY